MSFDLVPADLIQKIFHQLPIKDRVRLSGVNRQFRDASMKSIAKMKSLVIDDDLMEYLASTQDQSFSSLLESCSPTLESIDVNSCPQSFLIALAEFVYPKLEQLEITGKSSKNGQMKRLISRNQNLRSVILNLDCQFEWPEDIVFEKMEKLEIQYANFHNSTIDLSPTLRPLIGNTPNLRRLLICTDFTAHCRFTLSAQEFNQLLASTPNLEELNLDLSHSHRISVMEFKAAIPTWHLPRLTTLHIDLNCPKPSSILHRLPNLFPRLQSLGLDSIKNINNQDIMALSQLKYLRELNLARFERMKAQQIIDLVISFPLMTNLTFNDILDVDSPEALVNFLTSTAAIFRQELVILLTSFTWVGSDSELEDILEEMKNSDGPVVIYLGAGVMIISYKSLDG